MSRIRVRALVNNDLSLVAAKEFKVDIEPNFRNMLVKVRNKTLMVIGNPDSNCVGQLY